MKEIKYLVSSSFSFFFQLLLAYFLSFFFKNENLTVLISIVVIFFVNFLLLKYFVFQNKTKFLSQLSEVIYISIFFRISEFLIFYYFNKMLDYSFILIYAFVLIVSNIFKFFLYKKTFRLK